jgi:uncharacterized membrane protein
MSTNDKRPRRRINQAVPIVLVLAGVVYAVLAFLNGKLWLGVGLFVFMAATAAALVFFAQRSETVAMLTDDVHEERNVHLHSRASLFTVNILAFVLVVGALVDMVRGGDGWPWLPLIALLAISYVVSLFVLNKRS